MVSSYSDRSFRGSAISRGLSLRRLPREPSEKGAWLGARRNPTRSKPRVRKSALSDPWLSRLPRTFAGEWLSVFRGGSLPGNRPSRNRPRLGPAFAPLPDLRGFGNPSRGEASGGRSSRLPGPLRAGLPLRGNGFGPSGFPPPPPSRERVPIAPPFELSRASRALALGDRASGLRGVRHSRRRVSRGLPPDLRAASGLRGFPLRGNGFSKLQKLPPDLRRNRVRGTGLRGEGPRLEPGFEGLPLRGNRPRRNGASGLRGFARTFEEAASRLRGVPGNLRRASLSGASREPASSLRGASPFEAGGLRGLRLRGESSSGGTASPPPPPRLGGRFDARGGGGGKIVEARFDREPCWPRARFDDEIRPLKRPRFRGSFERGGLQNRPSRGRGFELRSPFERRVFEGDRPSSGIGSSRLSALGASPLFRGSGIAGNDASKPPPDLQGSGIGSSGAFTLGSGIGRLSRFGHRASIGFKGTGFGRWLR